ncbi:hypothetical protein [Brachybacterium fresconis]|uniref:Uncharacterized protein n=1 Tax=Brachybacterium fresconis TaxID=173363 RepID=A0ABS4YNX5_9MICO|nr:hypothetical protein [Brachybacterium fresconis]MBP2410501.1 hypothetical protein [Brachybacterium fresconis]
MTPPALADVEHRKIALSPHRPITAVPRSGPALLRRLSWAILTAKES